MAMLDHIYFIVTGAGTARRAPEILSRLIEIGPKVIVITTPNAARIVAHRELALVIQGKPPHQIVEGYFDEGIVPRPPHGLVLVAPCSFDSLNKLGLGIADNLALSVVAEAIGRQTPVIVGVSVNVPLWVHPQAKKSTATLRSWGVDVLDPVAEGETVVLASTDTLIESVKRHLKDS